MNLLIHCKSKPLVQYGEPCFLVVSLYSFYMNALLLHLLSALASLIIRRHRPYIIGVTGTVGKTTITTTIAMMLRQSLGQDMVAISPYHYNGEYGLPLAIMQAKSGGKNILLWIVAFGVGISQIFRKYPKYIVLEYGIDHP